MYFWRKKKTLLDEEIDDVLERMNHVGAKSEEYLQLLTILERLSKVKKEEGSPLSRDTIVLVGGNLLGLILIMAYERTHVMSSKAVNQLIRPR